jgi:hypothetical protein
MAKVIPVSTFKIFRHNFWTNEWSRFLYEGHYYHFKESGIAEIILVEKKNKTCGITFVIPRVWLKEYRYGVFFSISQFPKVIRASLHAYDTVKDPGKKRLLKIAASNQIRKYFVKKIAITNRQAKALMDIQFADITLKRKHAIHKRIGLS